MAPWDIVLPRMASSAAKNTDWRKKQKEIPSQKGNIPSSTSPKKEKKPRSFFKPVSLVFAWGFPCFLFYLNRVCQSDGQVLNMSMARTARAFYSLYPWGEDGTHASCLSEIYTQAGDFWPERVTSVQSRGAVYETLGRSAKGQWNWSIAGDTAENIHSYSVLLCHLFISSHMAAMSRASDFFV